MCLTKPQKIKKINNQNAELENGQIVSLNLIENPQAGDWILTNANLAISKITPAEAEEINNYFK
jgi:hydrogenase maturation factor